MVYLFYLLMQVISSDSIRVTGKLVEREKCRVNEIWRSSLRHRVIRKGKRPTDNAVRSRDQISFANRNAS